MAKGVLDQGTPSEEVPSFTPEENQGHVLETVT